jgi:signal transduction histidine kinase/predicted MFS family arabinose efflux permease/ActR/RegA family two-component response regulator
MLRGTMSVSPYHASDDAVTRRMPILLGTMIALAVLSQFFRSSSGIIAPALMAELHLSADAVGELSGAFFLVFALLQIPVGVLIDRFGARLTVATIMVSTVAGSLLFAMAQSLGMLILARVLIGIGCSGLMVGSLVVLSRWLTPAGFSGAMAMLFACSNAGSLAATLPLAAAATEWGWRPTFIGLAALAAILGLLYYIVVRDAPPGHRYHRRTPESVLAIVKGLRDVFRIRELRFVLPLVAVGYATSITIVGLWGAPYLHDVYGLDAVQSGNILSAVAIAMILGTLVFGRLSRWLPSRRTIATWGAIATGVTLLALGVAPDGPLWHTAIVLCLFGFVGAYSLVVMAHGLALIPDRLAGRGTTTLNAALMAGAAIVQTVTGLLVNAFPRGEHASAPYGALFLFLGGLTLTALLIYRNAPDVEATVPRRTGPRDVGPTATVPPRSPPQVAAALPRASAAEGGALTRYGVLALAALAFFIAIFFMFQTLFAQKELIERQSRVNIWLLAQTEIEYQNMIEALDRFVIGDADTTKETLEERFELFWSRLPILLHGEQSAQLRLVDGLVESTTGIIASLERIEPAIAAMSRDDPAGIAAIRSSLSALHAPLQDMVRGALLIDHTIVGQERKAHEDLYTTLLGLFGAVLLGGGILFLLLFRQTVRTQNLAAQARRAEQSAQVARSELLLAIESISEGFIIYDQEDRVALFNERYKELHPPLADVIAVGVTFENLLRQAIARGGIAIPADEVDDWVAACLHSHLNPGEAFESQLRTGKCLKISERKTIDGRIVGVHTDVTDLKNREIELIRESALLQSTFENIDQGIAVFDAEARLQTCNELFATMNGLPAELVAPGRAYSEILRYNAERGEFGAGASEEHLERRLGVVADLRRADGGQRRFERRRPDGTTLEVRYSLLPDGRFLKTYTDITERLRAEEERARLLEQFHASQRVQAIGTLAGGIAHDFNNILGSILGNCFLLLEDIPAGDPARDLLQQIAKSGNRAKGLVQQILAYSRNTAFTAEPLAMDEAARESIDLIRSSLPPNVELICGRWDKARVAADPTQLHQIFLNLCLNAAQAIGDAPGQIRISIELTEATDDRAPAIGGRGREAMVPTGLADAARAGWLGMTVGARREGRSCRVIVEDTGCGMDRATMQRIFEPFFTTKEVGQGTGLGLAAVHGILRNHKATITIESCVGRGTRFLVDFPVCEELRAGGEPPPAPPVGANHGRILLVEDDQSLLDTTSEILARLGYDVVGFSKPEDALAAFRQAPGSWDLILTDRAMPRLDGEELAEEILRLRPGMPIIMCTGFGEEADEERARRIGVREFLFKPLLGPELSSAIRRALLQSAAAITRAA